MRGGRKRKKEGEEEESIKKWRKKEREERKRREVVYGQRNYIVHGSRPRSTINVLLPDGLNSKFVGSIFNF